MTQVKQVNIIMMVREDNTLDFTIINDGLNPMELLGLLQYTKVELKKHLRENQVKGSISNKVTT